MGELGKSSNNNKKIQWQNAHNIPKKKLCICDYSDLKTTKIVVTLEKRSDKPYFCPHFLNQVSGFSNPSKESDTWIVLAAGDKAGDNNGPASQTSSGYLPPDTPHLN